MSAAKAIYDKAVIDAWQTRRAGYLRDFNRVMWSAAIIGGPVLWLVAVFTDRAWTFTAAVLILTMTIAIQWARHRHLRCPCCRHRVHSANASPVLPQPQYCRRCLHWLESPYASDQPET